MRTEVPGASGTGHGGAAHRGPRRRPHLAVPAVATAGTATALWLGASLNAVLWGAIVLAVALAVSRLVVAVDAARRAHR
ncbi:hypothetical protein GCM10009527_071980 [Actinomadura nitritigenes]|uniref:Uncharacterized protein n=1 Tax=Actinomadura nitritigenes TaxID=134602 RepID=A0ABS3R550_9ACTN|nr:hypothetical protein [Actinomadura nitritigenes]MBO2441358.1 hypothetical protein [Actinomadura nitritigenes]